MVVSRATTDVTRSERWRLRRSHDMVCQGIVHAERSVTVTTVSSLNEIPWTYFVSERFTHFDVLQPYSHVKVGAAGYTTDAASSKEPTWRTLVTVSRCAQSARS